MTQNMFECARLAAYLSRVRMPDYARWVTVEEALTMATEGSAGVLDAGEVALSGPAGCADVPRTRPVGRRPSGRRPSSPSYDPP